MPPWARGRRFNSARTADASAERVRVHLADNLRDDAFLLLEQRQQQMFGKDLGMALALGQLLRGKNRFLCFLGVLVDIHDVFYLLRGAPPRSVAQLERALGPTSSFANAS